MNTSASASFSFHASHLDSIYCASSVPVIFSIFALSVGVNQRSLRTTAFGMFRVIVSTHGVFIDEISRVILFFNHSVPHFISASPYFAVLFAIPPIAGITAFSRSGQATAPHTVPIAISPPVGSLHSSSAVYIGVACAHAIAPLVAVAHNPVPFMSHSHFTGIGAVATMLAHVLRALL
jgi:hypothetical protein